MDKGLIHIYCGDGKGKTTASLGLALRAAGRGFNVRIIQFLKSQDTGEIHALKKIPEITLSRSEQKFKFYNQMSEQERKDCRDYQDKMLSEGFKDARSGEVDLLILDEILSSYRYHLVDREVVLSFLKNKPESLEVVLTGRDPAEELVEIADYVSEIKKIKHPFDQGIPARIGIER